MDKRGNRGGDQSWTRSWNEELFRSRSIRKIDGSTRGLSGFMRKWCLLWKGKDREKEALRGSVATIPLLLLSKKVKTSVKIINSELVRSKNKERLLYPSQSRNAPPSRPQLGKRRFQNQSLCLRTILALGMIDKLLASQKLRGAQIICSKR